jgi:hypothetical protein
MIPTIAAKTAAELPPRLCHTYPPSATDRKEAPTGGTLHPKPSTGQIFAVRDYSDSCEIEFFTVHHPVPNWVEQHKAAAIVYRPDAPARLSGAQSDALCGTTSFGFHCGIVF